MITTDARLEKLTGELERFASGLHPIQPSHRLSFTNAHRGPSTVRSHIELYKRTYRRRNYILMYNCTWEHRVKLFTRDVSSGFSYNAETFMKSEVKRSHEVRSCSRARLTADGIEISDTVFFKIMFGDDSSSET